MKDSALRNMYRVLTDIVYLSFITFFTIILGLFITTGAALTASFNVMRKLQDQKRATYIFKEFKESFLKNFVQSTIVWLMISVVGLGLYFAFNYAINTSNTVLLVSVYVSLIELTVFISFVFPIIAVFKTDTFGQLIKNTVLMMHGHFSVSLRILGTVVTILYLVIGVHSLFVFFGIPIYLYFNSFILRKTFDQYIDRIEGDENEKISEL